jgi:ComF family protein
VSNYADRCRNCIGDAPAFCRTSSFGLYDATLASAIHHYKFLGLRRLAGPLAHLLLFYDTTGIDAVIPVPLTHDGLKERGFNQSLLLAYTLAKKKRLPLIMDILKKVKNTAPQVGLSAKERTTNVRKAFVCTARVPDMNILLIDDVMTTGATVNACAGQLLSAGASSVSVLTLARAGIV